MDEKKKKYDLNDDYFIADETTVGKDVHSLKSNSNGSDGDNGLAYVIRKSRISIVVVLQFIVALCGMYASYAIMQSQVSALTGDMLKQKDANILILEKLGRIEVDIIWLKEIQRDHNARDAKEYSK